MAVGVLFALVVLAAVVVNYVLLTTRSPGGNDSIPRYYGARAWLFEGLNPYSQAVSERGQMAIYGRLANDLGEDKAHFAYPFYVIFFYVPLAFLSFEWARAVGMVMLQVGLAAVVIFGARAFRWAAPPWLIGLTSVWAILFYHGARTIVLWQFAGIAAALIAVGLWATKERRDAVAGVCLALSTAKPQMAFLLFPLVLLWSLTARRFRLAAWLAGSLAALTLVSLAFVPSWPLDMVRQTVAYQDYTDIGSPVNTLTARVLPALGRPVEILVTGLLLGWLLFEWWRVRRDSGDALDWPLALTLVVTNLIALRTATTNYVMMIPAALLLFARAERAQPGWGRALVLLTLLATFVGLWLLFVLTLKGRVEQAPMYLPLPFGLLAGLAAARPRRVSDA